jgi:hypothetical protein
LVNNFNDWPGCLLTLGRWRNHIASRHSDHAWTWRDQQQRSIGATTTFGKYVASMPGWRAFFLKRLLMFVKHDCNFEFWARRKRCCPSANNNVNTTSCQGPLFWHQSHRDTCSTQTVR